MEVFSKKNTIIISTLIIFITFFVIFFINNASAHTNDNPNTTSTDANVTTQNIPNTRKPPVSIINYSNIITESADTYTYPNSYISSNTKTSSITKFIIIGDSRTVHIKSVVGKNNHIWSCKSSMGLKWMKSTGVPSIEGQISKGCAVIILMGVNDLYNTENYINYINQKSIEWANKGAKTYFVSVNPINESSYSYFKNTTIEEFNYKLKSRLQNVEYIDTYNHLKSTYIDFTKDGLHYNKKTSLDIYNKIMSNF